jgi:hypothetical protein
LRTISAAGPIGTNGRTYWSMTTPPQHLEDDMTVTPKPLTDHEDLIVDDMISLIDYTSRVLIAAGYGSRYQLDKAYVLRRCVDRLIGHLETETLDWHGSEAVQAKIAREARYYTLARILIDAGRLGGTA